MKKLVAMILVILMMLSVLTFACAEEVFSDMPPIPENIAAQIGDLPTSLDQLSEDCDWQFMLKLCDTIKPTDAVKALVENGVYTFAIEEGWELEWCRLEWQEEENGYYQDKDVKMTVSDGLVTLEVDPPKDMYSSNIVLSVNDYQVDGHVGDDEFSFIDKYFDDMDTDDAIVECELSLQHPQHEFEYSLYVFGEDADTWEAAQKWYVYFDEDGQMLRHSYE